ncbi:uncharacterized protein FPRN_10744 [Fusarium proliferatum]|nr:uncharacterized protein FPRN_10744 [Fusarium proliferatum]
MPLPRILRLQDDRWENPEDSIGTFIGYLSGGRYRCWEAAGPARQAFRELSPDIKDFLETSSIPPTDIVSWSMYMIGHNERNAAPKVLICSTDAKARKKIRQLIRDSRIMEKYPGIGLGDVSALPDRPVIRELSREAIEALLPFGCDVEGAVLADAPEPAVGKRIFVVNPHDFSLRPATTGPIILRGGKCYQLTVAHVFRQTRELDHSSGQQMAEDDCDFDGMSDTGRDEESQYDEITSKGSATPGEIDSDKASFEASLDAFSGEKHSSSRSESPSSDHLDTGHDLRPSVEYLEDNPGFGEFDVSQLQFFGRLALSSLTGSNPSLDYALIETSKMPDNAERSSMITGSLVSNVGEIEADDISIVATTSPHCLVEGRLTATPSYVRLSGQHTFQEVYPIRLGKPLQDGDCGTAVFGKDDNRFYGHIVAGGPGTSIAFLIPAGEISRDVQARIGFGLMLMPQQQHSKDHSKRSAELSPDTKNFGVTPIRNLGIWDQEKTQNDRRLESIEVQQWLQQKPNSQPSQNTFINSQPLSKHKSRTNDLIDHVDDVLGAMSEPSSVQTSDSSIPTALHTRNHPTFNNLLSIDERLLRRRVVLPSLYPTLTVPDRKIIYQGDKKHDKGNSANPLPSQDSSTISAASSGPQTRSQHRGPTASPGQQFSWSRAGTDASSASDKQPKRQNSHTIDDMEHGLPKRLRVIHQSLALPHTFPAPFEPFQPATGLSLEAAVNATQGIERRARDAPTSPSHGDIVSSSTQRDGPSGSFARRSVLPGDFEGATETCFFWLFDPKRLPSVERRACLGRKHAISLIITHAADHHGLIRGRDPQYTARKYLASCQSHDPFVKAKGNCEKCRSLHEWDDSDFADLTHHGVVLCLRCWRKFDKKGMREHMAGPLCDYNAEQPKTQKLWILYTAFCSETQLPSKPPQDTPPRKSGYLPSPLIIRKRPRLGKRPRQIGQDRTAASVDNLDTKRSSPDTKPLLPRLQPRSSLLPPDAEESTNLLHSPKLDGSMRFWDEVGDFFVNMGSNPDLHPTTTAADPPPTQLLDRQQELEPESELSHLLRADLEKDSGYRSADGEPM